MGQRKRIHRRSAGPDAERVKVRCHVEARGSVVVEVERHPDDDDEVFFRRAASYAEEQVDVNLMEFECDPFECEPVEDPT